MSRATPDLIPAEPIRRVMRRWLEEQDSPAALGALSEIMYPASKPDKPSRQLNRILNHHESISFDVADRLLCAMHLAHLWHDDPELSKIYQAVDLAWLDYSSPTCPEVARKNQNRVRRLYERTGSRVQVCERLGLGVALVNRLLAA